MASPIGPIRTLVDVELEHVPRGPALAAHVDRHRQARAPMALPPTLTPSVSDSALSMTWADFQERNPEWRGSYWAECRALYAGGDRLLGDQKVLERLFPRHLFEAPNVYQARKERAHYFPYPGTIIDHLLAGLGTDPLTISFDTVDDKGVSTTPADAEWWCRWVTDVADEAERPADYGLEDADEEDDDEGGRDLHSFCVDVLREALQTRSAWVLADLPEADPEAPAPTSRRDLEESGALDPYLCLIPAEQVIDWQSDNRGRLEWAMMLTEELRRESPRSRRGIVRHTYVMWDATSWAKYVIDFDPATPPAPNTVYQPAAVGSHEFGRVPLERLVLPEGMFAMGKLHSLAREHFNKRCAMGWAEYKSLFAVLYEFLGSGEANGLPIAEIATDGNRAVNQVRGQGYTQVRAEKDRAEFVGPPPEAYVAARESCNDAMREMHRVMYSMALSANMDSAAIKRSGDSKGKDNASTGVLLDAFGGIIRRFVRRLLVLASLGRGKAVPSSILGGLEEFDVQGTSEAIAEAVEFFAGVPQKSNRVTELALAKVYKKYLGDVTQEDMEHIREEIRETMSAEEQAAEEAERLMMEGMQTDINATAAGVASPGKAAPGKPGAPGAPTAKPGKKPRK